MKTVLIARGAFLTGTEIADAVSTYALALRRVHEVDTVDIPFDDGSDSIGRVTFTIGAGIETATVTSADREDEMFELATILELHTKADSLRDGVFTAMGRTEGSVVARVSSVRSQQWEVWDGGHWEDLI
jgi:hypothetical protein